MRVKRLLLKLRRHNARFESFWNKNLYLAISLLAIAGGAAIWTHFDPQSPGFSIGLLALAAGIMSIRPNMKFFEKLAWVAVLVTFTYQEVKAIKQNDLNNEAIRKSQNNAFGLIVDDLKTSIENSKDQYKQTVDHVDSVSKHVEGVATTTQQIADLAKKNLEDVTGGESYAYVYPDASADERLDILKIHNDGDQSLNGVTVTVVEIPNGDAETNCNVEMIHRQVLSVGILAPHDGRIVQNAVLAPTLRPDGTAHFHIWINAQNPGVSEDLIFRQSPSGGALEYKLTAHKVVTGKKRHGDVEKCGAVIRYVKLIDWTTTAPQPK